jgi:hypothetical protein
MGINSKAAGGNEQQGAIFLAVSRSLLPDKQINSGVMDTGEKMFRRR